MTLYKGNTKIRDTGSYGVYKGSQPITAIFKGSELVYIFQKQTRFDVSSSIQSYTVPNHVHKLKFDCVASRGYTSTKANGGKGGRVQGILNVTPNQTLYLFVGAYPTKNSPEFYNASDIRTSNADFSISENRIVVAGGGGNSGRGSNTADVSCGNGGAGGGLIGGTGGIIYQSNGGAGGTQSAGGAGGRSTGSYPLQGHDGRKGYGGYGGYNNLTTAYYGGTGGAGWYGGGGGSMQSYNAYYNAGGGGGSSYTDASLCSDVVHTQGYNNGAGYVILTEIG